MLLSKLNEKQKEAVLAETKRLLVLAGAGSGKTKTLIQKLLYLLSEKATKPSSILAITFTKNATNEMVDQLIIAGDDNGSYEAFINDNFITKEQKEREREAGCNPNVVTHQITQAIHSVGLLFCNAFKAGF